MWRWRLLMTGVFNSGFHPEISNSSSHLFASYTEIVSLVIHSHHSSKYVELSHTTKLQCSLGENGKDHVPESLQKVLQLLVAISGHNWKWMSKSQFVQQIYHFSQELSVNRLWLLLICLALARVHQIFYVNESWPMDCSQTHVCSNCFNIPTLTFKLRRLRSSPGYNRYSFIPEVMRNLPFRQKIAIEIFPSFKTKHSKSETDLWHWQKGKEEIEKILINEIYLCCGWWSKGNKCSV